MKVNIPITPDRGNWTKQFYYYESIEDEREAVESIDRFFPSSFRPILILPWIIPRNLKKKKKKTRQAWNNVITLVVKNIKFCEIYIDVYIQHVRNVRLKHHDSLSLSLSLKQEKEEEEEEECENNAACIKNVKTLR